MSLPKYFKDSHGYCYAATPELARQAELTAWDGTVDKAGFAMDSTPTEPAGKRRRGSGAQRPVEDTAQAAGEAGEAGDGNDTDAA